MVVERWRHPLRLTSLHARCTLSAPRLRDAPQCASQAEAALAKHGADLDLCASDLAQASEWDSLLEDLAEMGFENRDLNKALMLRHNGNLKRTVKALVEDA